MLLMTKKKGYLVMVDFDKSLENGKIVCWNLSRIDIDAIVRKITMGNWHLGLKKDACIKCAFSGLSEELDELGEKERFSVIDDIYSRDIVDNGDGTRSVMWSFYMWDNARHFKANRREYAVRVPVEVRFTPGKCGEYSNIGWFDALQRAETIRNGRKQPLAFENLGNGKTLVKACDGSSAEVNTAFAEKTKALVEEYGIEVVSLDTDHIVCVKGELSHLNLHVENTPVLADREFKAKHSALTKFGNTVDWDVWFLLPGHERNAFFETVEG